MPRLASTAVFHFVLPCTAGMTGVYHHIHPLVEMGAGLELRSPQSLPRG
jgi:hypothetical protein